MEYTKYDVQRKALLLNITRKGPLFKHIYDKNRLIYKLNTRTEIEKHVAAAATVKAAGRLDSVDDIYLRHDIFIL